MVTPSLNIDLCLSPVPLPFCSLPHFSAAQVVTVWRIWVWTFYYWIFEIHESIKQVMLNLEIWNGSMVWFSCMVDESCISTWIYPTSITFLSMICKNSLLGYVWGMNHQAIYQMNMKMLEYGRGKKGTILSQNRITYKRDQLILIQTYLLSTFATL